MSPSVEWHGEQLLLRPAASTDRSFIFATWMRSYRQLQTHVAYDAYHRGQERRVERLWRLTTVACRESAPDTIHAWVCGKPGVLHYAYVPPDLREKGLARTIIAAVCGNPLDFTHRWPFNLPQGWRPNEYLLEDPCSS